MMLPTHALVGLALATPLALVSPELGFAALVGALAGSVFPDLDMYAGHRRTLHFPTLYPIGAAVAVVAAVAVPIAVTVAAAAALVAAAVHCRMDVYGGGLELRPWEGNSEKAVYDHVSGRWIAPKRWIGYDGSPGDLAFSVALAVPLYVALDGMFTAVIVAALVVATAYTLLRRRLPDLAPLVVGSIPMPVRRRIPARYRD